MRTEPSQTAGSPGPSERSAARLGGHRLRLGGLEGPCRAQHQRLLVLGADDLQPDRQARRGEARRHADRRLLGEIERVAEAASSRSNASAATGRDTRSRRRRPASGTLGVTSRSYSPRNRCMAAPSSPRCRGRVLEFRPAERRARLGHRQQSRIEPPRAAAGSFSTSRAAGRKPGAREHAARLGRPADRPPRPWHPAPPAAPTAASNSRRTSGSTSTKPRSALTRDPQPAMPPSSPTR